MIAAVVFAIALGVLATYALTGRGGSNEGLAASFVLGLPVLSIAAAGLDGISLPWAVGAAVVVILGLLLAPRMPARRGPFAAAVSMTVGIILAAGVVRWLVPIVSYFTGLNSWFLALAVIAAGAAWAAGGKGTLNRTAMWLSIVTAVLLLVAGIVAGAPATLTSPLVPSPQTTTGGVVWLVALFVFTLMHPAPGRSAGGAILVGVVLLLGLIGLLSVVGGYLPYPSTGLFTITGYASSNGAIAGTVLGLPVMLVAVVATGAAMRASLEPWTGYTPPRRLTSAGTRITVVAVLVGLFTFAPTSIGRMVVPAAIAGIIALIVDRRSSDETPAVESVAAGT